MVFVVLMTMTIFETAGAGAVDDKVIGSVKTLKGEGVIVREGVTIVPEPGTRLYQTDVVRTGKDGAMGIILRDETALAIGPSSELSLKEFVFRPKEGMFASVVRFVRGTLVYITGQIARLSPDSVKVETPVGFAAVRGTKFLIKIGE
ncbi:MAG TPA: FecR domain-containing protein [Geobacteraceae bacterium]